MCRSIQFRSTLIRVCVNKSEQIYSELNKLTQIVPYLDPNQTYIFYISNILIFIIILDKILDILLFKNRFGLDHDYTYLYIKS